MLRNVNSLLFLMSFLMIGCTSVGKSHMNQSIDVKINSPMQAKIDVDLSRKLTGYASGGFLLHLFQVSGDNKFNDNIRFNGEPRTPLSLLDRVNKVKAAAAYNAIRTATADILVNPQYVVEENHWNPFFKLIKVKVTGYPGRVVSIKNKE